MTFSDDILVRRCRDGDREAFSRLVERHQRALTACLLARLGPLRGDVVEEIVQESFVRAFLNLSRLRTDDRFFSWLVGIALRTGRELVRRAARERRRRGAADLADLPAPERERPDPRIEQLGAAVAALPAGQREVLWLRYYAGLNCAEIARRLEMPLGSVTKRLSRAYQRLRVELPRLTTSAACEESEARP